MGDIKGIARGLNNLGSIYGIRGEYDKARQYLMESLDYSLKYNDLNMVGVNYQNLGYYMQVTERLDLALIYFEKAKEIYHKIGKPSAIISTKVFLAEYYLVIDQTDMGLQYALEALNGAREHGLKRLMYETSKLLNTIYLHKHDSIKAYNYKILELQMKDSLNIEENQTELSMLEMQYQFEKIEHAIKVEQQRKKLVSLIIWVTLGFLVIFIILLWGRLKLKAKAISLEKEKLKTDLELRTKDLTSNAMNLMKKNETLTKIASRLKILQKEASTEETKRALSKIRLELNKLVEDEGWEEFEVRFKQVHTGFYNLLIANYPDLTPLEQRLCAFLRLNMTTKEISDLTGQTLSALEMSRSRLRKN
ncbi:MAG: tetratricopeptide repeat protein [Bacteroidales bacterium]